MKRVRPDSGVIVSPPGVRMLRTAPELARSSGSPTTRHSWTSGPGTRVTVESKLRIRIGKSTVIGRFVPSEIGGEHEHEAAVVFDQREERDVTDAEDRDRVDEEQRLGHSLHVDPLGLHSGEQRVRWVVGFGSPADRAVGVHESVQRAHVGREKEHVPGRQLVEGPADDDGQIGRAARLRVPQLDDALQCRS